MASDSTPYTPPADKPFYMTDAFTDHAIEQLDEQQVRQPWFQYLAYTAPHWPLHAPKKTSASTKARYSMGWDELRRRRHARMVELGLIDRKWKVSDRDPDAPTWESATDKKEHDRRMAVYAAQIDRMDRNIGRVLSKIRAMGQEENTLILSSRTTADVRRRSSAAKKAQRRELPIPTPATACRGRTRATRLSDPSSTGCTKGV
jgi:arylsulfatase